ncbi:MAG: AraC family transcriptional regulator [Muribaculaceae bacterium]|nr:AraC family transcriptional regulator [Muribaculaceae bacterium]
MKPIPIEIERNLKLIIRVIEIELAFRQDSDNPVTVKSLVEVSGMSERSLREWFKLYTGLNISEYINRRKREYGARIFCLFPDTTKQEVADIIGLSTSHALYPFMRRGGILDMNKLRGNQLNNDLVQLPFRQERLLDCILLYTLEETLYKLCADPQYETSHWDKIEQFVKSNFPAALKVADVGFALDKYVENKIEEGIFISGVLYRNLFASKLSKGFREEIGWKNIPGGKYAVFTFMGDYDGLSSFYQSVIFTILQSHDLKMVKSSLIMEKYINSPVDTPTEELITEIWVPIVS